MKMNKFKVGDKVRINPSIKPEELRFGSGPYTQDKSAISGKIMRIIYHEYKPEKTIYKVEFSWYNYGYFNVFQNEIIPVCVLPDDLFEL